MVDFSLFSLYARRSVILLHIDTSFHSRHISPLFSLIWLIFSWHPFCDFLWFIWYFIKSPNIMGSRVLSFMQSANYVKMASTPSQLLFS